MKWKSKTYRLFERTKWKRFAWLPVCADDGFRYWLVFVDHYFRANKDHALYPSLYLSKKERQKYWIEDGVEPSKD